ncbi:GntR family transcriptional regulator [Thermovenabulum gondwanense]|uniref:Putative HTH-type transcriptional regulator YurK n=1 Tax=Thermovenabulum gondwanense TaxID=520767 RepID=A0A162MIU2_9FIRM|nr:GntR family transcriptional regulator [Thermovenabulum gondwanense]KYO66170.1 putative HTH-type transcriptional regulator YurK [Thermovenabulum gondwanense]
MKLPVYLKIAADIREKILKGELRPGDAIYSEHELCREYNASRMTVRKGLAILLNEGYIYSIQGKGNYVKEPEHDKYVLYFNEIKSITGKVNNMKLLKADIIKPPVDICNLLQISESKNVVLIERLFYEDDEPVAYDKKFLVYFKGMPIIEKELIFYTFPELVAKSFDVYTMKKELTIYAKMPDEFLKDKLKISELMPLMVVEQKLYNKDNRPVGFGTVYFRGDYFKLFAQASLSDDNNKKLVKENFFSP